MAVSPSGSSDSLNHYEVNVAFAAQSQHHAAQSPVDPADVFDRGFDGEFSPITAQFLERQELELNALGIELEKEVQEQNAKEAVEEKRRNERDFLKESFNKKVKERVPVEKALLKRQRERERERREREREMDESEMMEAQDENVLKAEDQENFFLSAKQNFFGI